MNNLSQNLSMKIEKLVKQFNLSYIDALIDVSQQTTIEIEDLVDTLKQTHSPVIEKLKVEFHKRNMVKDSNKKQFLDDLF